MRTNSVLKLFLTVLVPMAALGVGGLAVASLSLNAAAAAGGLAERTVGRFMGTGLVFVAVAVPVLSGLQTLAIVLFFRRRRTGPEAEDGEPLPDDGSEGQAGKTDTFTRILELYRNAVTDPDTGAVVFRHFKTMLDAEVERAKRYKVPLSVVRLSLLSKEKTKTALQRVSVNVRSILRTVDVVSVDSSKDFIVLLPHTRKNNAEMAVWRIWKRIKAVEDQMGIEIPLVAGIASFGEDGEDTASILATAEEHCRRAAVFGPGKVIF